MKYAKIENGVVLNYPYSISDFRRDNANLSLPFAISTVDLAQFNVFPVASSPMPTDHTKNYYPGQVQNIDGVWTETWESSDASQEEISQRVALKWSSIRKLRNELLVSSDWTQLPDVSLSAEIQSDWSAYRQQLRDITNQPDPFNIWWPGEPGE